MNEVLRQIDPNEIKKVKKPIIIAKQGAEKVGQPNRSGSLVIDKHNGLKIDAYKDNENLSPKAKYVLNEKSIYNVLCLIEEKTPLSMIKKKKKRTGTEAIEKLTKAQVIKEEKGEVKINLENIEKVFEYTTGGKISAFLKENSYSTTEDIANNLHYTKVWIYTQIARLKRVGLVNLKKELGSNIMSLAEPGEDKIPKEFPADLIKPNKINRLSLKDIDFIDKKILELSGRESSLETVYETFNNDYAYLQVQRRIIRLSKDTPDKPKQVEIVKIFSKGKGVFSLRKPKPKEIE